MNRVLASIFITPSKPARLIVRVFQLVSWMAIFWAAWRGFPALLDRGVHIFGWEFTGIFLIWSSGAFAGWRLQPDSVFERRIMMILVGLLAISAPPLFSTDSFLYVSFARVSAVYGESPFMMGLRALSTEDFWSGLSPWDQYPTNYGPVLIALQWPLGWISILAHKSPVNSIEYFYFVPLFFLKASFLGIHYLTARLAASITHLRHESDRAETAAWFYFMNPIILFEGLLNGHNDVLIAFMVLMAVYWALRQSDARAALWVALAMMAKLVPVVLFPALFMDAWRRRAKGSAVMVAVIAALASAVLTGFMVMYPMWAAHLDYTSRLIDQSLPWLALHFGTALRLPVFPSWFPRALMAALIIASVLYYVRPKKKEGLLTGLYVSLFWLTLVGLAYFQTWYTLPLLTVGSVLAPGLWRKTMVALTGGMGLSYFIFALNGIYDPFRPLQVALIFAAPIWLLVRAAASRLSSKGTNW